MLYSGASIDRYTAEHQLGHGGMADVWAVRHKVLGTMRAVKVLHQRDRALRARLVEEGRVQARLDHPNVLPVLDVVTHDGAPVLVMPLVDGPPLDALLAEHRPSLPAALAIFRAVAAGVGHAHDHDVAHRDLKPGNVLLDLQRGRVVPRVTDFGLAKAIGLVGGQTRAGAVLGTPGYAAPEQLTDAAAATHLADMWSLGVLLYELLTGERPFSAPRLDSMLLQMETRGFAPPSRRTREIDPAWDALISDLLQPEPSDRVASCVALLARLDAIHARPESDPLAAGDTLATTVSQLRSVGGGDPTPSVHLGATQGGTATMYVPRRAHNLPPERDTFVGRDDVLSRLAQRLTGDARLVTLTGPGGTGKTRLAVEVCRRTLTHWPGGVWLCDLSDAVSMDGIAFAVATAFDVRIEDADPVAQMGNAMASREACLIVLDTFEQLVQHASASLGTWLDMAPGATFLVTSREPLRLRGEKLLPLGPLALPKGRSLERIAASEAVALFVERARDVSPRFVLDEDNAASVGKLVGMLDGLPLALELAAARIRTQSPERLVARLGDRLDLLRSRDRDTAERHRTLVATLDWSWDLLHPWERATLAQLSVFEGGCTLDDAEAVIDLDAWDDAPWVEDVIAELVDKSLARTWTAREPRFGLLSTVRAYAAEHLRTPGSYDGSGPEAEAAAFERHWMHYGRRGEPEELRALDTSGGVERRKALVVELDNLVVALHRAIRAGSGLHAAQLALAAWAVAELRGPSKLAAEWLAEARVVAPDALVPDLQLAEAVARAEIGQKEAADRLLTEAVAGFATAGNRNGEIRARLQQGDSGGSIEKQGEALVAAARETGDRHLVATSLAWHGDSLREVGRVPEARETFREALDLAVQLGDRRLEARIETAISRVVQDQGDIAEARQHAERAVALRRELGDLRGESRALNSLAISHAIRGEFPEADAYWHAALVAQRDLGARQHAGISLGNLGLSAFFQQRNDDARALLDEALAVHRSIDWRFGQGHWLNGLALLHLEEGRPAEALACANDAVVSGEGFPQLLGEFLCTQARARVATDDLDGARESVAKAQALDIGGRERGLIEAALAEVASHADDHAAVERHLAAADAIAEQMGCKPFSDLAQAIARARRAIQGRGRSADAAKSG